MPRWCKPGVLKTLFGDGFVPTSVDRLYEDKKLLVNKFLFEAYDCIAIGETNSEFLEDCLSTLKEKRLAYVSTNGNQVLNKASVIESFLGAQPDQISIHPPKKAKTKGRSKRIKSGKEVAMDKKKVGVRLCKTCNEYANHDSRNCAKIQKKKLEEACAEADVQSSA